MSRCKLLVMFAIMICFNQTAPAHKSAPKSDSSKVFKSIEKLSKTNRLTLFMYSRVFKPATSKAYKEKHPKSLRPAYYTFEGKIIRNITVSTVDPFGYSISDSAALPLKRIFKIGNTFHVKTQNITITNILLIREKEPFDFLLAKESERLIRTQFFVRGVAFYVTPVQNEVDSVDILIRVVDTWSIIPNGSYSKKQAAVGFTENNFIGFGHQFQNDYTLNRNDGKQAFATNYRISNIRNSFIGAVFRYNRDQYKNSGRSFTVERPFYSPIARWAAGLDVSQLSQKDTFADGISGKVLQNIRFNTQDYWAGNAIPISKGSSEYERTTKVIYTARYLRIRYLEKPATRYDSLHFYSNEDFCLSGVGFSTLKYFQDNYVFNFGVVEDVPVGKLYGITAGYQIRNRIGRLYLGTRISFGDYYPLGYLSASFEFGTFLRGASLQQGVFSAGMNYFSDLMEIGKWRVRQFVKPQITWGMNRYPYDSLSINDANGIRGFSSSLRGTHKIVITVQTQFYAPLSVLGFRFGPYLVGSFGMLGDAVSGFTYKKVYSQFGVGALIKNDYLFIDNFQLSLSYYPSMPGKGYDIFKINAFKTFDFGFRDFNFGKPEIVSFQ
jgi:hypothetical protein